MKPTYLVCFIAVVGLFGSTISSSSVSLEDIIWIVGSRNESQSQTCLGNGLRPFYMGDYDLQWDADTLENIVTNTLHQTVLADSANGVVGCCAPGLWCYDDGCFTQGFGNSFSNYGWLSNNNLARPVYTCLNDTSGTDVTVTSESLSSGYLTVNGHNFGSVGPDITISVDSQYCSDPQVCTCTKCTDQTDCGLGQDCIVISSGGSKATTGECLTSCGGPGDTSCPCGYDCAVLTGTDYGTFYACIPGDFTTGNPSCSQHDILMCTIPNIYQNIYSSGVSHENVSIALTSSEGAVSSAGPTGFTNNFCNSNDDCNDGNLCTIDSCSGRLCVYTSAGDQCGSILPTIRSRYTPYMFSDTLFLNRSNVQSNFTSFLVSNGTLSSVTRIVGRTDLNDIYQLPFSTTFFGNLVSQVGVTPYGVVTVEPQQPCTTGNDCPLFTTASNAIALWFSAHWSTDADTNRGIYTYTQTNESVAVYDVGAVNAFHVLYVNVSLNDSPNNHSHATFGASIYEDGSIRVSYIDVGYTTDEMTSDTYFGLWGSYAYKGPTRYHQETLYEDVITSGVDVVYCPLSALACVPQSCVAAGETLTVNWNGTNTCIALGTDSQISLTCSWAGGLATTAATFTPAPNNQSLATVSCAVPALDFSDGSLLFVDVVVSVSSSESINTNPASSALPGTNTIYMATTRGEELSRSNLQVRYYSSTNSTLSGYAECGCSALSNTTNTCDAAFVCGGDNDYLDCAGTPFGAAFEDSCGMCVYGMTGVFSDPENCNDDDSSSGGGNGFLNLVSQTIILLIIICCMTFVTSTISYSVRRMLIRRRLEEQQEFEFEADLYMVRAAGGGAEGTNRRGLSEFECDALGTIIFTQEFYREHKKKQLELMHGIAATSADSGTPTTANGMGGCDCPICLMDITEGNVVRALPDPCGHVFHVACIDQWFKQSHVCPLCKRSMRAILEGEEESTSDSDLNPAGNSTTRYPTRTTRNNNYGPPADPERRMVTLDRIRTMIQFSAAGAGNGGSSGAGTRSNASGSANSEDPEAGIAMNRYPPQGTNANEGGAGGNGAVTERTGSGRHFDL